MASVDERSLETFCVNLVGSYEILCHEDGTTVIDFWQLLALLFPTANLGVEAVPLITPLPRCIIKPAQLKAIPSSLRGDCSSLEVLVQCNRIESRVITGDALPLPLQLSPAILWFQIISNQATEQLYQLYPYRRLP
jgi:hypothetical protein